MFDVHTDTTTDVAALLENKGITPAQVVDTLALIGDSVDNVPGVDGIGPKTAVQLVQQFGSIDGILAGLDQIKGKRREALERARDHLPLSRTLVTLRRDADFPFDLETARVRAPDVGRLVPLFQQLGFHRFQDEARRLAEQLQAGAGASRQAVGRRAGAGRWTRARRPRRRRSGPARRGATGPSPRARTSLRWWRRSPGSPSWPWTPRPRGWSGTPPDRGLPLLGAGGRGVRPHAVPGARAAPGHPRPSSRRCAPSWKTPAVPKCGHNVKFDASVLRREGVRLRGVVFDSMLASQLIDPTQPSHKLDLLAETVLSYGMIPITDLIGEGENQGSMADVPLEKITEYAAEDADVALRLALALTPRLEAMGLAGLMRDVEAPLALVLAEMEANGILCDGPELLRQGEALAGRVTSCGSGCRGSPAWSSSWIRRSSWRRCFSTAWG